MASLLVWSEQPRAEHAQNWGDGGGPTQLPITITNNTVSAMETFRFLGSSISEDVKWETNTDYHQKGLAGGELTGSRGKRAIDGHLRRNSP